MNRVETLIIGAGVSGLSYANFTSSEDYLVLEAEDEIGGYCRTIKQDGFVWDYSGHFFHFRQPEIEQYLVSRMPEGAVRTVAKSSKCLFGDRLIEFPFQKNIHQLAKDDFIDCLHDLYFREEAEIGNFKEMLYAKFGRGICDRFLVPYNEKLYACDLTELDVDAMGRFFPYADIDDVIRNFKRADNDTYNATFTYPIEGAFEYIRALKTVVPDERISLRERLLSIDLENRVATTNKRQIGYDRLISTAPFNRLLEMGQVEHDPLAFSSNKVLVFNLGFDRKGPKGVHWIYVCERQYGLYRVGFYDNILDSDRMSLYVEIGLPTDAAIDDNDEIDRVLDDLTRAGIVDGHELLSHHSVILDPAYVHITTESQNQFEKLAPRLEAVGVHSIGRYGGWKYCAIEDNIIEARELVERLEGVEVDLTSNPG